MSWRKLPWKAPGYFWSIAFQSVEVSREPLAEHTIYQARIQHPSWLTQKAWDMQVQKSHDGWKALLRPWSVRPSDTDIFLHVEAGSTSAVLQELRSNRASLHDRDPEGLTLLHYAAKSGQFEVLQELIEMGLDPYETDWCGDDALMYVYLCMMNPVSIKKAHCFMLSKGILDAEIDAFLAPRGHNSSYLHLQVWRVHGLLEFIATHSRPDLYQSLNNSLCHILWGWVDPSVLLNVLQDEKKPCLSPAAFRAQLSESGSGSLNTFAQVYLIRVGQQESTAHSWRALARWVLSCIQIKDLCRTSNQTQSQVPITPLLYGLIFSMPSLTLSARRARSPQRARHDLSKALKSWLEDVQLCGVDLKEYGRYELSLFQSNDWLSTQRWTDLGPNLDFEYQDADFADSGPRLKSFLFGPRPEDWVLIWDDAVEEYASEFWDMIDDQPPPVPGGWVDGC
ncbi:hypothetical protein BDV18DRAFT_26868 [Aspergillus unguis]